MEQIFQLLASLSCGIAVTTGLLFLAEIYHAMRAGSENELEMEEKKHLPIIFYLFMPFTAVLYPLIRSSQMSSALKQATENIQAAGYELTIPGERYLSIRILSAITGLLLFFAFLAMKAVPAALLALLIFALYPQVWLKKIIRQRHLSILKALPNLLDLLTLSVEAGKDFLTALREINARRQPDALTEELARTLHEIQLGKNRQQALREMGKRVHQADLTSILNAIIQADELGVSIAQLLRIQGDQLRAKRFSLAEKLANEAPVKILFPVVIFIFPSVFFVLMGPILAQAMQAVM